MPGNPECILWIEILKTDVSTQWRPGGSEPLPDTRHLRPALGNLYPLARHPGRLPGRPLTSHTGHVGTKIIQTRRGRDGKDYPVGLPRPREELNRMRWLVHHLVCRDGLSLRVAQRVMLESYACRRSMGSICRDLARFECPHCASQEPSPAPQPQERLAAAVHQAPSGFTGMLGGDG